MDICVRINTCTHNTYTCTSNIYMIYMGTCLRGKEREVGSVVIDPERAKDFGNVKRCFVDEQKLGRQRVHSTVDVDVAPCD